MTPVSESRRVTIGCPSCGRLNRVDVARASDRPKCGACAGPIPLDHPVRVTDQSLEALLRDAEVPVLVDFYADWCGPCKVMAPVLDSLARDRIGKVLVAKLDTDRNQTMTARFAIGGIPTVIAFRGGREVGREVGAVPRPRLEALVDRAAAVDRGG